MDEEYEITEAGFADALQSLIEGWERPDNTMLADAYVRNFDDAGVLTMNQGLEVTLKDGSTFQVTVIRSR